MLTVFPTCVWPAEEFHRQFMLSLDTSFEQLRHAGGFDDDWRNAACVTGTKTMVRQSPLLGNGAAGRDVGGFWLFAKRYMEAEGSAEQIIGDRCGLERYQDFALYTAGSWYAGEKEYLLVAEAESNPDELLGELSGLIAVRCPHKYLFIAGHDTLHRLNTFCENRDHRAIDWAGTTYFVIEIPDEPTLPSTWQAFQAKVQSTGNRLVFRNAA
jgi:hypothetical protein